MQGHNNILQKCSKRLMDEKALVNSIYIAHLVFVDIVFFHN